MNDRIVIGFGRDHLTDKELPIFGELSPNGGFHIETFYKYITFTDQILYWVRQHESSFVPEGETIQ